jgi:acyl carrier protein
MYIHAMGLDTVEIVLRTEEVFGISLPDDECEQFVTVGDLYKAVLTKLDMPYISSREIEESGVGISRLRNAELRILKAKYDRVEPDPAQIPWTAPDVWLTLEAIITDQLQIEPDEVREHAAFLKDLGCD